MLYFKHFRRFLFSATDTIWNNFASCDYREGEMYIDFYCFHGSYIPAVMKPAVMNIFVSFLPGQQDILFHIKPFCARIPGIGGQNILHAADETYRYGELF